MPASTAQQKAMSMNVPLQMFSQPVLKLLIVIRQYKQGARCSGGYGVARAIAHKPGQCRDCPFFSKARLQRRTHPEFGCEGPHQCSAVS